MMSMEPQAWRANLAAILVLMVLGASLLGACADNDAARKAGQPIQWQDLPAGIGRGYPVISIDSAPAQGGLLKPGEAAPDFLLVLDDGRYLRLSDLKGMSVVINFWATWCGPCRQEMPELVKAAQDPNLAVLAVDVQEARKPVEQFAEEFRMNIPAVLDTEGKVRQLYRVPGLPTTYFVGKDGKIASLVVGPLTADVLAARLEEIR